MLGRKFRILRKERGMTLKQLSGLLNISVSFLSDIENNRSYPSIPTLLLVCKKLGIKPEYFFSDMSGLESRVSEAEMISKVAYIEKGREILEELCDIDALGVSERDQILSFIRYIKNSRENQV